MNLRTAWLVFVLALPGIAIGQNAPGCLTPTIVVNVRDQQGKFVSGLASDVFRVRVGDQDATIESARTQSGVRRVVLLVDLSGSISGSHGTWGVARAVAGNLLVAGPSTLRLALVLFSEHIIDTVGFDRPPTDIVERLANLERGKGGTAIIDALAYAIDLLNPSNPGDAVYLITDGGENTSHSHRSDLEKAILSKGVRLFPVVVRHENFPTPEEDASVGLLPELAKTTGGLWIDIGPVSSFKDAQPQVATKLNRAYDEITRFYQLQLEIPLGWPKRARMRMDVVDEQGKRRKSLTLSYPEYLLPCPR